MASAATLTMPVVVDAAPTLALLDEEFFLAMESGRIQWGDLMDMNAAAIPAAVAAAEARDERVVEWWTDDYKAKERLEGWEVPDLTLRSGIEEHFPVVLLPLPASEDGRERFIVKFDDRVDEWAATRAESQDENAEYAEWVQTRLIFALRQYSHKYILESDGAAEDSDHVAIFAMAHPSAAARRARAAIPTLSTFPVTWEQDRADHTRHLVKIHQKRVADEEFDPMALADAMHAAMTTCTDCTFEVITTMGSPYLFTVTIPTAPPPKRYVCTCVHCGGAAAAPAAAPAARPAPAPAARPAPAAAPHPAPAAAPRPAPAAAPRVAVGGAGAASSPRALDVMRANKLAWDRDRRDGRIHRIKHRSREQETRILAELSRCCDCIVEPTPRDPDYMCVLTLH